MQKIQTLFHPGIPLLSINVQLGAYILFRKQALASHLCIPMADLGWLKLLTIRPAHRPSFLPTFQSFPSPSANARLSTHETWTRERQPWHAVPLETGLVLQNRI